VTVTIADLSGSEYVKTKSNLLIKTDAKLGDVQNIKYDAVVIPGGPSYKTLAAVIFFILPYNFCSSCKISFIYY